MTSCRFDDPSPCGGSDLSTVSANLRTASSAACWPVLTDSSTCSDNSVGLSAIGISTPCDRRRRNLEANLPAEASSVNAGLAKIRRAASRPRLPCLVLPIGFTAGLTEHRIDYRSDVYEKPIHTPLGQVSGHSVTSPVTRLLLILPVGGNAVLCPSVHLEGADLNLDGLSLRPDDSGV